MVGQMAIAIAFPGFNDLGRTVTPVFLLMDRYFSLFSLFFSTDVLHLAKK